MVIGLLTSPFPLHPAPCPLLSSQSPVPSPQSPQSPIHSWTKFIHPSG
ncbi:MAG: hypothetical protein ACKO9I_22225 [Sphaerospermopsis kisseleviana]